MEEGNETGKLGRAGTIFKKRVRTDSVKGFLDYGLVGEENEGGGGGLDRLTRQLRLGWERRIDLIFYPRESKASTLIPSSPFSLSF